MQPHVDIQRFFHRSEKQAVKDLAIFYGVGIVLHLLGFTRPLMIAITPIFLLLTAVYVIGSLSPLRNPRVIVFLAGAFLAAFGAEVAGVATGAVFGVYRYARALGPRLFGVPPLIGLIWCLVVLGAAVLADTLFHRKAVTLFLAPLLCVAFDVVLERGAVFLGYWTWEGGSVPLRNYAAWGVISLLLSGLYLLLKVKAGSRLPAANFVFQSLFFLSLFVFILITGEPRV